MEGISIVRTSYDSSVICKLKPIINTTRCIHIWIKTGSNFKSLTFSLFILPPKYQVSCELSVAMYFIAMEKLFLTSSSEIELNSFLGSLA